MSCALPRTLPIHESRRRRRGCECKALCKTKCPGSAYRHEPRNADIFERPPQQWPGINICKCACRIRRRSGTSQIANLPLPPLAI